MKLWRRLGYAHMNEYLERELGYAPQVGIERLRIAHALATLPQIEARLTDGGLPYSAVRELTRVATTDTEQDWLDRARGKTLREIEAMVSGRKRGDRPDDPKDPNLAPRVLRLELSPTAFALFRQAQSAMADEHGGHLDDSALIEVLSRRAMEGTGGTDRPAYQIALTLCEWCGRGWQNGAGREVDVEPAAIERAQCDAELLGSLDVDEPERLRTTVTPRVRRQVFARDHHRCTVPGCRSSRNLDLHHIEFQSNGGGHEMSNLTILCNAHHQSLHEGLLTIQGTAPHALEFAWNSMFAGPLDQSDATPSTRTTRATIDDKPRSPTAAPPATGSTHQRIEANSQPSCTNRPSTGATHANGEAKSQPSCANRPSTAGTHETIEAKSQPSCANRPSTGGTHTNIEAKSSPAVIDEDARVALVTAGYKPREARAAVENARPHVGESATLEQVIREALRQCGLARVPTSKAPDDFDKAGVLPQVGKSRSTLRCSIG
jgi:hypothetical protein